ncbi:MAG: acetolactate decarboxylase [Chloroflexota bacterium]|nr:acetolactate decarboxylase [Chloroflexota bacterium]
MKAWVRDDVPAPDRDPDGRASPMPQGLGFRPGASSGRASGEPGLRMAPGREGHTPVVTSGEEVLAQTADDEVSRKPKKAFRAILASICLGLLFLCSCTPYQPVPPSSCRGRMTQVSVINALMIGRYGGVMPIPELLRCGDFGVGTLDHLDGELIVLDGRAYQVRGDGVVVEVGPDRSTPFATVTRFEPDGEFPCPRAGGLTDLDARLDDALRQENHFLAIRVDGRFASITLRSVHRQEPPYRPLGDVVKGQSVWTHEGVSGTLVGVRCPAWVGGLNVPGYHWHFLSDDRKVGGHVLDCQVREGRVRHEVCRDWLVKLDGSAEFNGVDLGEDLSRDLRRVESSRGEGSRGGVPRR